MKQGLKLSLGVFCLLSVILFAACGSDETTHHHKRAGINAMPLSAGPNQTCALTSGRGVECWGYNYNGELGDGTTVNRKTPVSVSGLSSGVAAVSAGNSHTCVVTSAGGAKCWGDNAYGELGDGTTANRKTSVDVTGLTSGVIDISADFISGHNTCVLTEAGAVKCMGWNYYGQLGDGTTTNRKLPVDVTGLSSGVKAISDGSSQSCALTTGGGVKCWGDNYYGQLGDGTTINRKTPVDVTGLTSGVKAISAGSVQTCALTTGGGAKCWGYNSSGELGDGTTVNRKTPVDVTGLTSGVIAISAGQAYSCALTTGGGVKCWGNNLYGQLGDGTTVNRKTPVDVTGLTSGISTISAGGYHSCAMSSGAAIFKCWGYNSWGQLGDGTTVDKKVPTDVLWP